MFRVGGTVGGVLTCPLEVVKTRLQSSAFNSTLTSPFARSSPVGADFMHDASSTQRSISKPSNMLSSAHTRQFKRTLGIYQCIRHIVTTEGFKALFKGLTPTLIGVAPTRAIYFYVYAQTRQLLNVYTSLKPDSSVVYSLSAAAAGFCSTTLTNPIWFVKTRMQLNPTPIGFLRCALLVYHQAGFRGFYRGISASYYGISETVIHFVIYEAVKEELMKHSLSTAGVLEATVFVDEDEEDDDVVGGKGLMYFVQFMVAGGVAKMVAATIAYPHEIARTRMREAGSDEYRAFWQTLGLVYKREGVLGLYRGLGAQLVRQIPNTALMMATYEIIIFMWKKQRFASFDG